MISISIFLVILVLALAFYLFFKLLKGVVKAIIAVLFLTLFVTAILGVIIYFDVLKIKNGFDNEQTVLLSHEGNVVAGFQYDNSGDSKVLQSNNLVHLTEQRLSSINSDMDGTFADSDGLAMVIDSSYFENSSLEIADGILITFDEEMINAVFTCTKLSSCVDELVDAAPSMKKQIESSFEDVADLKNNVFVLLFAEKSKETKGAFIIAGIREGDVIIYPQLTSIRLVKMIPDRVFNFAINKAITDTAETMGIEEI